MKENCSVFAGVARPQPAELVSECWSYRGSAFLLTLHVRAAEPKSGSGSRSTVRSPSLPGFSLGHLFGCEDREQLGEKL